MTRKFCAAALVAAIFLHLSFVQCPTAFAASVVGPDWATKLVFYNASNATVTVGITGSSNSAGTNQQDGCPVGSLKALSVYDLTAGTGPTPVTLFGSAGTKAWFQIPRGHQVQVVNTATSPYTKQQNWCMQGLNFGFGAFSAICPDTTGANNPFPVTTVGPNFNQQTTFPVPNGTNGFEATINLPGTIGGKIVPAAMGLLSTTAESCDITCLAGANSAITAQYTPPAGGPFWTTTLGATGGGNVVLKTPFTTQNSWVNVPHPTGTGCDDNCVDPKTGLARPGVYPYGCSQCNNPHDPGPPCGSRAVPPTGTYTSQICAAKNGLPFNTGCLLQRSPLVPGVQKFGGTILVTYTGPLSPPTKCP